MKFTSNTPLVSVIILCYNQSDIISRAIESVLNQTYQNIQLVIVDDCSSDKSKQVIEQWQSKFPQKIKTYFQLANVGHPANMNKGYRLCDGELITFCDGDDWYFPQKVEKEVHFLKMNPDVDVVHSNFDFFTIDGHFVKHWTENERQIPTGEIFRELLTLNYPNKAHLRYEMTSKKIIEETGFYDEQIPIWVDWDFRLRLAAKHKFGYCSYTGSAYTENPRGLTNILKQETILKYYQFVVNKNITLLEKHPKSTVKKIKREISLITDKLSLAISVQKNQNTFFKTLSFIWKYPSQLSDVRFVINSLLGKKTVSRLAAVKNRFK